MATVSFFSFLFFLNCPDLFLKVYSKAYLASVFGRIKKKKNKSGSRAGPPLKKLKLICDSSAGKAPN